MTPILAVLALVSAMTLVSCAPNQPMRNRDAMLPEVDVLQLKENGDVALKLAQQCRASIDDLNLRVTQLERAVAQLTTAVQSQPIAQVEELQNQLTVLREELVILRKAVADKSATVPTFNPAFKKKVPEVEANAPDEYRKGLASFQNKSYSEAISSFDIVTAKFAEGRWAPDSWYWIGESYEALGDYSRAIAAFQKVFTYSNTEKADDSQFQIGNCYVKMGDRQRAVVEYKKVEELFPESEYVPKAHAELQKLQSK